MPHWIVGGGIEGDVGEDVRSAVPTLRQEKGSYFQASGAPPPAHRMPLALRRPGSAAAAGIPGASAPGPRGAAGEREAAGAAAGWAHLGRAKRFSRS